ncbi:toll/interleukin-1 receptor domain-containing protein [Acidovorax sp. DW039]|uniref:toll/interleukin-1 receptor domain-containing protein n=1 Tax=Acidovorax sp. DW039 TaxID=3095606 RepID=UPI003088AD3F|nr:toll/interleukin-1 receptor domain-containing protein [Acidovorax sp. DW039]
MTTPIYELALMGDPTDDQAAAVVKEIEQALTAFGLRLGFDVGLNIRPRTFAPSNRTSAAAAFFGSEVASAMDVTALLSRVMPVLPVVSSLTRVRAELPAQLWPINSLEYGAAGARRVASALLECAGLLPRQRRIFLSYRRDEARQAALQLFDALSARLFDVFLDTHAIAPAEDFQSALWHRLCDADVLLMLDTPTYFESRWTSAEFARALAKGVAILRVEWPDMTPSIRTATTSRAELLATEIDASTGHLAVSAIERICTQVEAARSEGIAVRHVNMVGRIRNEIEMIGGRLQGVGPHKAVYLQLPDGRDVVAYPTIGVPTSVTLHDATTHAGDNPPAVVYDHVGLLPSWVKHIDWLGEHVKTARWVKACEAGWQFADWT